MINNHDIHHADADIKHSKTEQGLSPKARELAVQYLPLVRNIVSRMSRTLPDHVDKEELHSVGIVGMISAVERYDSAHAGTFEAYVTLRIRGAILDELRRRDALPRTSRAKARNLRTTTEGLEQKLGRPPTEFEIRRALDLNPAEYERMRRQTRNIYTLSLEHPTGDDESGKAVLGDCIADTSLTPCFEKLESEELHREILLKMGTLPERSRKVLAMYYFEDMRLSEIAQVYGLTEARISQIHAQAISKLRLGLRRFRRCAAI